MFDFLLVVNSEFFYFKESPSGIDSGEPLETRSPERFPFEPGNIFSNYL